MGHVSGVYGVHGWIKVHSYTEPQTKLLDYQPWYINTELRQVNASEVRHKKLVVQLVDCDTREKALSLQQAKILVPADAFESLSEGEYYWHELTGLEVYNGLPGDVKYLLGVVSKLIPTGSHDVLVIDPTTASVDNRQRLIPYVNGDIVIAVNVSQGWLQVDWQSDY